MRGKSNQTGKETSDMEIASMRPAHYAREVGTANAEAGPLPSASMRPAHYAREVVLSRSYPGRICCPLQ